MGLSPKPLTQLLHEQMSRRFFGAVHMPGDESLGLEAGLAIAEAEVAPVAAQPSLDEPHPYDALRRIAHLGCATQEQQKERSRLLSAVTALVQEVESFEKAVIEERTAALTAEWKASKKSCRAQSGLCDQLELAWKKAEADLRTAINERQDLFNELSLAKSAKLTRWPSDAEVAAKEAAIADAKARLRVAERDEHKAFVKRSQVTDDLRLAREKMGKLIAEESRIRHAIDGGRYFDAEFGLEVR